MTRARDLVLHPIALVAIAVLIVNDHWLKAAHPSWLTGKLSDAAGLAFFPLLLLVAAERWAPRSWPTVVAAIVTTAAGFALVKTCPEVTALYRIGLGLLQWPLDALLQGAAVSRPSLVDAVTDPSDLLALPFTALAAVVAQRGGYVAARPRSASYSAGSWAQNRSTSS